MTPRAPSLPPDERRSHLIAATLEVLRRKGRDLTVRDIAEQAGVAEGTIFRVFASKDDLIDAALQHAFDPEETVRALMQIGVQQELRGRLIAAVQLLQRRFVEVFELTEALGTVTLPERVVGEHRQRHEQAREDGNRHLAWLVEADQERFRLPAAEVSRLLQMLCFAGTHTRVNQGRRLTPEEIVTVVLDGVLVPSRQES